LYKIYNNNKEMFSGTIKISNVDDYILPSKECVKPLQVGKVVGASEVY
jgi:hypothetical protein